MTRVNVGVRAEMKEDVGEEACSIYRFCQVMGQQTRGAGQQLNRTISEFQLNWPLTLENTFPFFIQSIRTLENNPLDVGRHAPFLCTISS